MDHTLVCLITMVNCPLLHIPDPFPSPGSSTSFHQHIFFPFDNMISFSSLLLCEDNLGFIYHPIFNLSLHQSIFHKENPPNKIFPIVPSLVFPMTKCYTTIYIYVALYLHPTWQCYMSGCWSHRAVCSNCPEVGSGLRPTGIHMLIAAGKHCVSSSSVTVAGSNGSPFTSTP